ncbi:hypothetical protein MPL1032_210026 [Mesorhizobium plurifarium]|uniref:Uncharacterized protein n=1 Tax=Mesorhizobium plurifarium TaxID=69974 RepID=A0A0K2VYG1_MESPL|nr:hypothetical protein MPL1032_210026 [Mesorhizobium plurifarium]
MQRAYLIERRGRAADREHAQDQHKRPYYAVVRAARARIEQATTGVSLATGTQASCHGCLCLDAPGGSCWGALIFALSAKINGAIMARRDDGT